MKYPGRGRLVPNEILDCTTSLFGGFKTALENLSEPQQKFLLHSCTQRMMFTAVLSEAWAKLRDWAGVAARGRLLLSGSVAHASLETAVQDKTCLKTLNMTWARFWARFLADKNVY